MEIDRWFWLTLKSNWLDTFLCHKWGAGPGVGSANGGISCWKLERVGSQHRFLHPDRERTWFLSHIDAILKACLVPPLPPQPWLVAIKRYVFAKGTRKDNGRGRINHGNWQRRRSPFVEVKIGSESKLLGCHGRLQLFQLMCPKTWASKKYTTNCQCSFRKSQMLGSKHFQNSRSIF
jgi:hypothetical protein